MVNWRKTINIKPVLQDSNLTTLQKAERIRELLKGESEFDEPVERLIEAGESEDEGILTHRHAEVDFNDALDDIYDIADDLKIWLGI